MEVLDISLEDLIKGYQLINNEYHCLFCETTFDDDHVYPMNEQFLTAKGMMKNHITLHHRSPFHGMLSLDKKILGLSDVQIEMIKYFYEGTSDKDIVSQSNLTSVSTVRQHRFKLREKERQAKLFLALMQLLKEPENYLVHKGAKQVDERYGVEQEERDKVLKTYFKNGLEGEITTIPSKEKKKLIILQHIVKRFEAGKTYSEKEVNEILKTVHADFVSLRRHLIEYGFMNRNDDGSEYALKM
ncbi:DUF2087 domain-containing protein [Lysinibacillus sp. RS5]|uniref:DUF2087 domain-containing protein n=1 Tax=unclassified Lysinibacillus TaxID=2636778 RepID=UPI0035BE3812